MIISASVFQNQADAVIPLFRLFKPIFRFLFRYVFQAMNIFHLRFKFFDKILPKCILCCTDHLPNAESTVKSTIGVYNILELQFHSIIPPFDRVDQLPYICLYHGFPLHFLQSNTVFQPRNDIIFPRKPLYLRLLQYSIPRRARHAVLGWFASILCQITYIVTCSFTIFNFFKIICQLMPLISRMDLRLYGDDLSVDFNGKVDASSFLGRILTSHDGRFRPNSTFVQYVLKEFFKENFSRLVRSLRREQCAEHLANADFPCLNTQDGKDVEVFAASAFFLFFCVNILDDRFYFV